MAWGGYSNGQIPLSAMSVVRGEYFEPGAAGHLLALENAFQTAFGDQFTITEGYRSYNTQVALYRAYQNGTGNLAAYPGTSNHGWGMAADCGSGVDSFGTAQHNWVVANGPQFGWRWGQDGAASEPWHICYFPSTATAGSGATLLEDDMDAKQANQLEQIYNALFVGGGSMDDAGKSIAKSLAEIHGGVSAVQYAVGTPAPGNIIQRVINLDQQVTGADGFDKNVGPSVAGRLVTMQQSIGAGVDLDALASKVAAALPDSKITPAQIVDELIKRATPAS